MIPTGFRLRPGVTLSAVAGLVAIAGLAASCSDTAREKDIEIIVLQPKQANDAPSLTSTGKSEDSVAKDLPKSTPSPEPSVAPVETAKPNEKSVSFVLSPQTNKTGIALSLPYTFGTHTGSAIPSSGTVSAAEDLGTLRLFTAKFAVPINTIKTGNDARDCHVIEAMGIQYQGSVYPKEHACDGSNRLPTSGPNAPVYNEIEFELAGANYGGTNRSLDVGKPVLVTALGKWSMHGIQKTESIELKIERLGSKKIKVTGTKDFSLQNFGIVVKPFGPVTVKDTATIQLDLTFDQQ
jgi:hypothetical protein